MGLFNNMRQGAAAARSSMTAAQATKAASGVAGHAKNIKIADSIMKHKGRTAAIGAAGFLGVNAMRGRRGPGVSKTTGRPTGMYKY